MMRKSDHIKLPQVSPALMSSLERSYLDELFKIQEELAEAEGSLYEFFKAAWPYIEGSMPFIRIAGI